MTRLLALTLALLPVAASAAVETFGLDPYHSSINFSIDHLGLSNIYGRFDKFTGRFTMDRAAKTGSVELSVDTTSVNTNENDRGSRPRSRDEHLRSSDFFNVAEFPKMTYKSTKVVYNGDNPQLIEGNLTLLGVTHPVTMTLERFRCNPASATAKEKCGGVASGKLKRSDYGMKRGIPNLGDEISLVVSFEAEKLAD